MKSQLLKFSITAVSLLTALALIVPGGQTQAQDCSTYTEQNNGNLLGYIVASNLPSTNEENRIWVSSTVDPWSGGPSYGVTYDRDLELLSGRGWNEHLRAWVDFDLGTSDQARVTDNEGNPAGGFQWGYWDGLVEALDNLEYSTNVGGFIVYGEQPHDSQFVSGTGQGDVPVGLGELFFDQVVFDISEVEIPDECREYVDLLANGSTSVNLEPCGQTVELVWNSNNVVPGSCQTVDNGAPWLNPGPRDETEFGGETSGLITESNTPNYFRLECEGSISGNPVIGVARVACEEDPDEGPGPGGPGGSGATFEFIES
jgi:hypothetical protein